MINNRCVNCGRYASEHLDIYNMSLSELGRRVHTGCGNFVPENYKEIRRFEILSKIAFYISLAVFMFVISFEAGLIK